MTKLGVLGGTFNPPHIGHLILAQSALEHYQLEKILFIPAAKQPHKQNRDIISVESRFRMMQLAIEKDNRFEISDIEIKRPGLSYTCDTLTELKSLYPEAKLYLIIGGDNISDMETWKDPEEIFSTVEVVAAKRPDSHPEGIYSSRIALFDMPQIDVSSTMIRRLVKEGKSISYLVPVEIEKYIKKHQLYL
ncbi:MAG: nicotinate-nucleotide adenylyltransferase [candidate division Zixibacteria bacterium]|nr:nicotinate-nucleotide adenylyltransferase [candidate division Zixibacteria bacterium]